MMMEVITITIIGTIFTTVMLVVVKEGNMFVQIFEHIHHGTNIQMEQRIDS